MTRRMQIRSALAAIAIVLLFDSSALAQAPDRSARFAAEALRICIDTRAAAPAVRQLAAAEGWTATDAKALPSPSSITVGGRPNITYEPSNIWTVDKDGLALTVLVYDIPERSNVKHCQIFAWDLDSESVDRALKSDPRVIGGFFERPGVPLRRYEVKKPRRIFRYGAALKDSRTLHVVTAH